MTDRPRALAVLIAVFLLGGIVGAGASYLWLRKSADQNMMMGRDFRQGPPEGRPRMRELLNLTDDQERKFRDIMAESRKKIEAIRAEQQPRLEALFNEQQPKIDAVITETNRELMSVLNKDQQAKFQSLWKEMRERRYRFPRGGRGMYPSPEHQP